MLLMKTNLALHILYTNIITCKQVGKRRCVGFVKRTVIGLHIHIQKTLVNILTITMIRPKSPSSMSVML